MTSSWPDDLRDAVFLRRALDQVGRAMFPEAWTGKEIEAPLAVDYPAPVIPFSIAEPLPPRSIAQGDFTPRAEMERERAERAIKSQEEQKTYRSLFETAARADAALQLVLERKTEAARKITAAAEAGDLTIYYLDRQSGETVETPRGWWRALDLHGERFNRWGVDWRDPMRASPYPRTLSWLFVERARLAALILEIGLDLTPPQPWWPLSNETIQAWSVKPIPSLEATARAKAATSRNPSEAAVCRALAAMWEEVRRVAVSAGSIQQYRIRVNGPQSRR